MGEGTTSGSIDRVTSVKLCDSWVILNTSFSLLCTNNYEETGINLSLTTVQAILEKIKTARATLNCTDTLA